MTKIQNLHIISKKENPKYVWVIDYWNLRFICNLVLGIWDFSFRILDCGFKGEESVFSFFCFPDT